MSLTMNNGRKRLPLGVVSPSSLELDNGDVIHSLILLMRTTDKRWVSGFHVSANFFNNDCWRGIAFWVVHKTNVTATRATAAEQLDSGNIPPRSKRKPCSDAEDLVLIAVVKRCGEGNSW
ncbi:hypothetical protein ACET3Z_002397 [Daucus carota]